MSVELARKLRMSPAEARMWNLLRAAPFRDFHFRRQVPIGRYYVDFALHAAKLVTEVDGDTHAASQSYDRQRDSLAAKAISCCV